MHRGNKDRMSALNNSSNEKWRMELDNSFHPDNTCRVRYSLRPKNRFDKEKRTIKGENGLMRGCFVEEAEKTPLEMEIEYRKGRQRMARTEVLAVRRSGFRHVEEVPLMKSKQPVNTRHVTQSTQGKQYNASPSGVQCNEMICRGQSVPWASTIIAYIPTGQAKGTHDSIFARAHTSPPMH